MAFDRMSGGDPHGPMCTSCHRPIQNDQRSVHIHFDNDPRGLEGYTGTYHAECGKVFQSLARVMNMNVWGRF
jgi:hypothetical protein